MTREEQIREAAHSGDDNVHAEQYPIPGVADMFNGYFATCFELGAKWADQHPNWIAVEDELPKADGRYIIADKYGGVEQMNFDAESKYWWLRGTGEMRDFVTHWMSLPQPPRKEVTMNFGDAKDMIRERMNKIYEQSKKGGEE